MELCPQYQIGVVEMEQGVWRVAVMFEPAKSQEEALNQCHIIAPLIKQALGGEQHRVQ